MLILNFIFEFSVCLFVCFGRDKTLSRIPSAKLANELQVIILLEEEFMISHFFFSMGQSISQKELLIKIKSKNAAF